jgi:hypothetical protein
VAKLEDQLGNGLEKIADLTHCLSLVWQIHQFTNEYIQQNPQIIGVEVLLRSRRGEQQIQNLEYEQLHTHVLGCIFYPSVKSSTPNGQTHALDSA